MLYYFTRDPETFDPLSKGEIENQFCPTPIWSMFLNEEENYKTYSGTYKFVTKLLGMFLLYFLNGKLIMDAREEWAQFKTNWSNHALPKVGLIASRVLNSFTYICVISMTFVLFFFNATPQAFLLNFLAVEVIQKVDDGVAERHKVLEGITTANGGARILLMSTIAMGVRNTDHLENVLSSKVIGVLVYGFEMIMLGICWYTFSCS